MRSGNLPDRIAEKIAWLETLDSIDITDRVARTIRAIEQPENTQAAA